jgi:DNA-binding transcriptional LysR family regulator
LARAAHLVDGELKRAIKEINSLAERGSGKLVVAGGVVMRYLLPPTLELLRRELPEIEIVVVEALAVSALTALARGDVDIAICPPAIDEIPSGICSEHLLHDSIAVVVHARHPVLKLANVAMADLQHYGWVMPGKEEKERQVLERALFAAGLPPPRVAVETSSTALIAQLLESQELLAYLPTVALKGDPGLQSLRAVAVRSPWSERDLHVFWRDASTTLPSVQRFLTCVRQAAQNIRVEVSQ